MVALGTLLCVLGIVGWMGAEIRSWSFNYYFFGLFLILFGFALLYGVNQLFEEERE